MLSKRRILGVPAKRGFVFGPQVKAGWGLGPYSDQRDLLFDPRRVTAFRIAMRDGAHFRLQSTLFLVRH